MRTHAIAPALLLSTVLLVGAAAAPQAERRTANDGQVVLERIPEIPDDLKRDLDPYLETRSAGFEDWTADGGILITTRFGEVPQLHHVARPGGARRQLTFFEEPIAEAERRPSGTDIAYLMDRGGSEFFQIFLMDPTTGDHRRLTDGDSRNGVLEWSADGGLLAFQSTRRNGRSNDVWVMDPDDPQSARMVLEAPDGSWWGPADWADDGARLLIQQYVSIADSRVHVLDLETGERQRIAGGEEDPGAFLVGDFDGRGAGVYLITDAGSEFRQLAHLDLGSGALTILTPDIPWDVDGFELSRDGRRAAFVVNENGIDRLYLMNPETRTHRRVDLPQGVIGGFEFDPEGRRLAVTLSTPQTPSDVFTVALGEEPTAAVGVTRWTASEVGGLDTSSFVEPQLIHYPTFDRVEGSPRSVPAFVYRPAGGGPHPVVVLLHGGPESQYRPRFSSTIQMWVEELGVAVVAPNVRGSSGYGKGYLQLDNGRLREDSVKDVGALLDWIAAQPDLDEERVAVYGGSYGGYMVLASLVHYSDRLRAGVEIVGISDFVTFLENTESYRRDLRRAEYGDERDPAMRDFLESISPLNHVAEITAPLFVAQGANDPRVPVGESEQIVTAVRQAGYDVWYMKAENEGHGFDKKENDDLFDQLVVLFLRQHLLPARTGAA